MGECIWMSFARYVRTHFRGAMLFYICPKNQPQNWRNFHSLKAYFLFSFFSRQNTTHLHDFGAFFAIQSNPLHRKIPILHGGATCRRVRCVFLRKTIKNEDYSITKKGKTHFSHQALLRGRKREKGKKGVSGIVSGKFFRGPKPSKPH